MAYSEDILFTKIKEGNKYAFDQLFKLYYTPLCRFALQFVHDDTSAEEIAQNVFITLWEHAPKLTITNSLKAYLFQSVRNQALNFIKSEATRKKYEAKTEQPSIIIADSAINHSQIIEFKKELNIAVDSLPDKCREIFCLCKFGSFSYKEIADILNISHKTVENQMGIAFSKLRETMKSKISKILDQF